jgi:hypothetical protein
MRIAGEEVCWFSVFKGLCFGCGVFKNEFLWSVEGCKPDDDNVDMGFAPRFAFPGKTAMCEVDMHYEFMPQTTP